MSVVALSVTFLPGHPPYYICPITILSGLYATSLMAVLNSRIVLTVPSQLNTWRDVQPERGFPMRNIRLAMGGSSACRPTNVLVTVTKEELVVDGSIHEANIQKVSEVSISERYFVNLEAGIGQILPIRPHCTSGLTIKQRSILGQLLVHGTLTPMRPTMDNSSGNGKLVVKTR